MQVLSDSDQIESPLIRELFCYWQSKCRDGAPPRRADIDPAEIPGLVSHLLIVDIEHEPFRVRYRLVGTAVVRATGFEFTGKYLDELILTNEEGPFEDSYRLACESRSAVLSRITWRLDHECTGEYDACFLPLSDDGETVNKVLSMECYANLERQFAAQGQGSFPPLPRQALE